MGILACEKFLLDKGLLLWYFRGYTHQVGLLEQELLGCPIFPSKQDHSLSGGAGVDRVMESLAFQNKGCRALFLIMGKPNEQ
jgi:hypothetical protein